ncbi:MAG: hypothetical protein AAF721_05605 [Myxococcota bacterium]
MSPYRPALALFSCLTAAAGCDFEQPATRTEMRAAVAEVALLGDGIGTQTQMIELTTSFTLGQGAQAVAEEVRDFVASQVACSQITVEPGKLTIDFGELGDPCLYRGRTYAGVVTVAFEDTGDAVMVTHTYEGVTGGRTTLDGTVAVEWNGNVRHVVTELDFVGDDGKISVEADRTQTFSACEGVAAVCLAVEGSRDWTGPRGEWEMDIMDVNMRSIDPVPESGSYVLTTPEAKTVELSFDRVDADTIEVSVEGGRRPFVFRVTAAGQVQDG